MPKAYKYKGILAGTRSPLNYWQDSQNKQVDAALRLIYDARTDELIDALFASCHVRRHGRTGSPGGLGAAAMETGWRQLALVLAERHVPGFSHRKKKKGRPRRTDELEIWSALVPRLKKGLSLREAAKHVAKQRQKDESLSAIESVYRRLVKEHPQLDVRQKSK